VYVDSPKLAFSSKASISSDFGLDCKKFKV
jgi:hypothetical protein